MFQKTTCSLTLRASSFWGQNLVPSQSRVTEPWNKVSAPTDFLWGGKENQSNIFLFNYLINILNFGGRSNSSIQYLILMLLVLSWTRDVWTWFWLWLRPSLVSSTTTLWIHLVICADSCIWSILLCFWIRSHCVMCCAYVQCLNRSDPLWVSMLTLIRPSSGFSLGLDSTYAGLGLDSDSNELVSTITPPVRLVKFDGFRLRSWTWSRTSENQLDQAGKPVWLD